MMVEEGAPDSIGCVMSPVERTGPGRQRAMWCVANSVSLILFLYGLKCVVTLSGQLLTRGSYGRRSFTLRPVEDVAALLAGLGYVAFGLFVYLSTNPPHVEQPRIRRVLLAVVRWGSLGTMIWLFDRASRV
jgi:hypothetical protein